MISASTKILHNTHYDTNKNVNLFDNIIELYAFTTIKSTYELLYNNTVKLQYNDTTILQYYNSTILQYYNKISLSMNKSKPNIFIEKPAKSGDFMNIDWVPNKNLGQFAKNQKIVDYHFRKMKKVAPVCRRI